MEHAPEDLWLTVLATCRDALAKAGVEAVAVSVLDDERYEAAASALLTACRARAGSASRQ